MHDSNAHNKYAHLSFYGHDSERDGYPKVCMSTIENKHSSSSYLLPNRATIMDKLRHISSILKSAFSTIKQTNLHQCYHLQVHVLRYMPSNPLPANIKLNSIQVHCQPSHLVFFQNLRTGN